MNKVFVFVFVKVTRLYPTLFVLFFLDLQYTNALPKTKRMLNFWDELKKWGQKGHTPKPELPRVVPKDHWEEALKRRSRKKESQIHLVPRATPRPRLETAKKNAPPIKHEYSAIKMIDRARKE